MGHEQGREGLMRYITPENRVKSRVGDNPLPAWDAAVISFRSRSASRDLIRLLDARPIGMKLFYGIEDSADEPNIYTASIGGSSIGIVTHCIWGGPQAAILVEEIACLGCKNVIGYSCAGAVDLSLQTGQQIVANRAIPTDGTSLAYGNNDLFADPGLLNFANNAAGTLGHGITPVCAATVDALYRETPEMVAYWRSREAQVINLETSPFYAAAQACGIGAILLGHVSDRLADTWEYHPLDRRPIGLVTAEICVEMLRLLLA